MEYEKESANTIELVSSSSSVSLPPIEAWGLDPLFHSARVVLINCLKNSAMLKVVEAATHFEFYYISRPVSKVEICGVVVNRKMFKNRG
jgi:hypothetical protein